MHWFSRVYENLREVGRLLSCVCSVGQQGSSLWLLCRACALCISSVSFSCSAPCGTRCSGTQVSGWVAFKRLRVRFCGSARCCHNMQSLMRFLKQVRATRPCCKTGFKGRRLRGSLVETIGVIPRGRCWLGLSMRHQRHDVEGPPLQHADLRTSTWLSCWSSLPRAPNVLGRGGRLRNALCEVCTEARLSW